MDATEEGDVALQRASSDLLLELRESISKFVYKQRAVDSKTSIPRHAVRNSATARLIKLLEPFQEWPQLLDPHLNILLTPLVDAFLQCLEDKAFHHVSSRQDISKFLIPLPHAICKLLYTLCNIRGPKVISRFFANEPRYIEPMLDAFRAWTDEVDPLRSVDTQMQDDTTNVWELKYIFMLWLSHLLLTPFDLDSLDSEHPHEDEVQLKELSLPSALPQLSLRLVSLAIKCLSSAGRERDASVSLLVRLALRPDMRRLGLHQALIQWALSSLKGMASGLLARSTYRSIGFLSFVAGIVKSADADSIGPFLLAIYQSIAGLNSSESEGSKDILSSALSRKAVIKIYCMVSIATIQQINSLPSSNLHVPDYVLEEIVDHLLTALADNDTPVRYAASKALSVITAKLDRSMAAEISDAVIGCLDENVLWDSSRPMPRAAKVEMVPIVEERERNLAAVNPLRWQGLILTLSHLLFRRSPPPSQLPAILNSLILALGFEQRSSSGTSIGASVRDAACFGIWSLARRYTTTELLDMDASTVRAAESVGRSMSILQILARELVMTATADPSGNIRRGASAALQELVGRHPDTIVQGISLVQTVDYHAVALRSRALDQVTNEAAILDELYLHGVLRGLCSWRGISAVDAESRRQAASAIGKLCRERRIDDVTELVDALHNKLRCLKSREIEKRHGLLLALAAIVREAMHKANKTTSVEKIWDIFTSTSILAEKGFISPIMRPELTAEATCSLIFVLISASRGRGSALTNPTSNPTSIGACVKYLELSLHRRERVVITNASQAARAIFDCVTAEERTKLLNKWIEKCQLLKGSGGTRAFGYIAALGEAFGCQANSVIEQERILQALLSKFSITEDIETKVEALKSLSDGILSLGVMDDSMALVIQTCLEDYTNDQRGDVGSLLRLQAIDAVRAAWQSGALEPREENAPRLISAVCVLAAEKLDKIRYRAWTCLSELFETFYPPLRELHGCSDSLTPKFADVGQASSQDYFLHLLSFFSIESLRIPLLRGLVTSVGAGSESALRASRAALSLFLEAAEKDTLLAVCHCLESLLRENLTNERLVVPILESIAFVLDTNSFSCLGSEDFRWRTVFILVQKAHYKTGTVAKLTAAIEAYSGLGTITVIKGEVLKKLSSLLLHPFPKIRNSTADALFVLTQDSSLTKVDFSRPPAEIKRAAIEFQRRLGSDATKRS